MENNDAEAMKLLRLTPEGRDIGNKKITEYINDNKYHFLFPEFTLDDISSMPNEAKVANVLNLFNNSEDVKKLAYLSGIFFVEGYHNYSEIMSKKINKFPSLWGAAVGTSKNLVFRERVENIINNVHSRRLSD